MKILLVLSKPQEILVDELGASQNKDKIKEILYETLRDAFNEINIAPSFTVVRKRGLVEKAFIQQGNFDAVIAMEKLDLENDEEKVSVGTLASWQESYKESVFILLLPSEAKGKTKIRKLYNAGYYNAFYLDDFSNKNTVVELIKNPRNREEALKYYGLEDKISLTGKSSSENDIIEIEDVEEMNDIQEIKEDNDISYEPNKTELVEDMTAANLEDDHNAVEENFPMDAGFYYEYKLEQNCVIANLAGQCIGIDTEGNLLVKLHQTPSSPWNVVGMPVNLVARIEKE